MGRKAGALLWNRQRIDIPADGAPFNVDTGLIQPNMSFADYSPGEPPLGLTQAPPGPVGASPASRVQVMPMSPIVKWSTVTHSEPFVNPATGTVWVTFFNASETPITDLNVLFWDPHAIVGPGQAETYNLPL